MEIENSNAETEGEKEQLQNTVVVQPFEDGTFRYLSNSIEEIELELPPIARSQ